MDAMTEAHRRCDLLLVAAEQALENRDWIAFRVRLLEFRSFLLEHFAVEEEELFPAFERRTGLHDPTSQLRLQHARMGEILDALAAVAPAHDPDGCDAELRTLGALYRQHKEMEERVLYPALQRVAEAAASRKVAAGGEALDLRGLQPPQPIVRIFEELERAPASPLRVVLPHEPHPLYGMLRDQGFEWSGAYRPDGGFELTIRGRG
jgi:hemerythrin superfamily protein